MTGSAATGASDDVQLDFYLTVTMESDWHIGIGAGRNRTIDRLIDRDDDGLPVIRSTTLRGMWRDGAEVLARGLDNGIRGSWSQFVNQLLGSEPQIAAQEPNKDFDRPKDSRMRVGDARFDEIIRDRLARKRPGCAALREALTFVKPGVKIEPETGTALDDHLRFEEVARAGAVLHTKGTLKVPNKYKELAAAFLIAAVAFVERLGGKRRRGLGSCRIDVRFTGEQDNGPTDLAVAAKILETATEPPALPSNRKPLDEPAPASSAGGAWTKLDVRLTLRSPVIIPDAVLGNVVTTLDHIPGSQLLPHVARALEHADVKDVGNLVSAGDLRVFPAYPEIDGARAFPIPFSWRQPKLGGLLSSSFNGTSGAEQQKPLQAAFVAPGAATFDKPHLPIKVIRTHNTVENQRQKPTEKVGGVYSYEALAPEQAFRTEIWVRGTGIAKDKLRAALCGRGFVGRARNAGYGEVDFQPLGEPTDIQKANPAPGDALFILIETDALLREPELGGAADLEALVTALEAVLAAKVDTLFDRKTIKAGLRTRRIESWQANWGLPRPSLIAIQAGSVVALPYRDGAERPTQDNIEKFIGELEREGIGERRAEGFGRLRVNPKLVIDLPKEAQELRGKQDEKLQEQLDPVSIDEGLEHDFFEEVERAAWQRAIARRADYFATASGDLEAKLRWHARSKKPPMSQLGALRAIMGRYETDPQSRTAEEWWKKLKHHRERSVKWPEGAVEALGKLVDKESGSKEAWKWLHLPGSDEERSLWGGVAAPDALLSTSEQMREKLGQFAVRALLHAAMRAHKRAIEEVGNSRQPQLANPEAEE